MNGPGGSGAATILSVLRLLKGCDERVWFLQTDHKAITRQLYEGEDASDAVSAPEPHFHHAIEAGDEADETAEIRAPAEAAVPGPA